MSEFTDWKVTIERSDDHRQYWFVNQGDTIEAALADARLWTDARIVGCELLKAGSDE